MHSPTAIQGTVFYDSREWNVGYRICPCTHSIRQVCFGALWCGVGMVWFDTCATNLACPDLAEHAISCYYTCIYHTWNVARTFSRSARWRIRGFRTRVWWPQTHSTEDHLCARLVPCDSLRLLATPCDLANIWKFMPSPSWRLGQEWESPGSVQTVKEPKGTWGPYGSFWAGLIPQRACTQNHAASFLIRKALNIRSFKHIPKSKQGTNWMRTNWMRWFKWFICLIIWVI